MITTNTYSTVPSYLAKGGIADRFEELTALAAGLARQAADARSGGDGPVLVAGSLPPLSESYRVDLVPLPEEAAPIYRRMVLAMLQDVDLFLCETMSCAREARQAAEQALAHGGGKPVYVSWTLHETPGQGLRSGETVAEALAALDGLDVAAFLFNCTHPEAIEVGIEELAALTDKPVGCYPNRLNRVPEEWTLDNEQIIGLRGDLSVDLYVTSILAQHRLRRHHRRRLLWYRSCLYPSVIGSRPRGLSVYDASGIARRDSNGWRSRSVSASSMSSVSSQPTQASVIDTP